MLNLYRHLTLDLYAIAIGFVQWGMINKDNLYKTYCGGV